MTRDEYHRMVRVMEKASDIMDEIKVLEEFIDSYDELTTLCSD